MNTTAHERKGSATHRARAPRIRQLTFSKRGGARRGAGRKPKGDKALVSHARRAALAARFPVLVTTKLRAGLPSLRSAGTRALVHDVLRACGERHGLRVVHFSILSNHVHALVEARDASALSRGMQTFGMRLALGLNRLWNRHGRVVADRFHSRILRTPREVRYALAYVLNNARKHGLRLLGIDPYSSGAWFEGWELARHAAANDRTAAMPPVPPARTWLLTVGWKRHGRIRIAEVPGGST